MKIKRLGETKKAPAPHWDESCASVVPPKFADKLRTLHFG